jgi:exonuclease VII small subunit
MNKKRRTQIITLMELAIDSIEEANKELTRAFDHLEEAISELEQVE